MNHLRILLVFFATLLSLSPAAVPQAWVPPSPASTTACQIFKNPAQYKGERLQFRAQVFPRASGAELLLAPVWGTPAEVGQKCGCMAATGSTRQLTAITGMTATTKSGPLRFSSRERLLATFTGRIAANGSHHGSRIEARQRLLFAIENVSNIDRRGWEPAYTAACNASAG